jgi:hypothetical protein
MLAVSLSAFDDEVAIIATPYQSEAPILERKAPRMQSAGSREGDFGKPGLDFVTAFNDRNWSSARTRLIHGQPLRLDRATIANEFE